MATVDDVTHALDRLVRLAEEWATTRDALRVRVGSNDWDARRVEYYVDGLNDAIAVLRDELGNRED